MRRLAVLALALSLAACATRRDDLSPLPDAIDGAATGHRPGDLIGMTAGELEASFGPPALQIREGPGLKLQWRAGDCVLDAYLYPGLDGQGSSRATHVDARLTSGAATNPVTCQVAIAAAR